MSLPDQIVFRRVFACLVATLAAGPNVFLRAHSTLGIHGLSNENPTGDPVLPEIRGAFEVELKARLFTPQDDRFNIMFEYSAGGVDDDTIFFGQRLNSNVVLLRLTVGGVAYICQLTNDITPPTLHTFKFGVDTTNTAYIYQDGTSLGACPANAPIPADIPRNHTLGTGIYEGLFPADVKALQGGIVGLRVTNLASTPPQHPADAFALRNIPSQTFSSPFVASFYARFDDPATLSQPLFEFRNTVPSHTIRCERERIVVTIFPFVVNTLGLRCFVTDVSGILYEVTAADSIVPGEFNFWHFSVTDNGRMRIEKDGVVVGQRQYAPFTLPHVFRSALLFGEEQGAFPQTFRGVLLGFRLDREITS